MTAEVVVANKLGVALAADSTVSIGDKTLDSANKLFALSKYHPVGILVYNTMNMTTVPMEILIKEYRGRLNRSGHKTLEQYANEFREHLRKNTPYGDEEERDNVGGIIVDICTKLNEAVSDKCDEAGLDADDTNDGHEVKRILTDQADILDNRATKAGTYPGFSSADDAAIGVRYGDLIRAQVRRRLRRYKLSPAKATSLGNLISKVIKSNLLSRDYTGIVVAGYGNDEHYPAVLPCRTDGFIVGKLKIIDDDETRITHQNKSLIYPFAQDDVIQLFVEGISDTYQRYIERGIRDIFSDLAGTTAKYFGVTETRKISRLKTKLAEKSKELISDLEDYRQREHVKPLLDAIKHLDKAELALLAESLVNITALKRKISPEIETVGGPIDVAVISKGDGFIWIKRKHYFDKVLNPFYFQKYLSLGETQPREEPLSGGTP